MALQLYKMKMNESHFGNGLLESASPTISCERLFSALVIEAEKLGILDEWMELVNSDDFMMSDLLFYLYGLYLPKPIGYPRREKQSNELNRSSIKKLKKLSFIHEDDFDSYISGNFNHEDIVTYLQQQESMYKLGFVTRKGVDPYRVGYTRYDDEVFLTVIATEHPLMEKLMESLQFEGLGGKRTSGYGRFELSIERLEEHLSNKITSVSDGPVMLLNSSLPIDHELDFVTSHGRYLLVKASGFAYSDQVGEAYRKHDVYKFKSGSTFEKSFSGKILNVAPDNFPHPVYHYAKPLFYRLEE